MIANKPIYSIAKDLSVDSNKILLACKTLGINAKGSARRLNNEEYEKIKTYFDKGKNVSQEIVDLNKHKIVKKAKVNKEKESSVKYFGNRLIGKS